MLNALDFGASPDGNNDNGALQTAINAAIAANRTLYVPAGLYKQWKPLRVNGTLRLRGEGKNQTVIQNGLGTGPVLVACPSVCAPPPLAAGLTGSGGNSYAMGSNSYAYDLRMDTTRCEFDGLSQFCVECYIQPTSLPGGPNSIIASTGRRGQSEAVTQCFGMYTQGYGNNSGQLIAVMTVGGTQYTLTGGSITATGIYHVALTYDGGMIRLFLTGQLVASQPANGKLTQAGTEDVILGASSQDWPYSTTLNAPIQGNVDSLRFSNTARYTANFTAPNAKLATDGSTLLCLNAYANYDMFTVSTTWDYIPIRRNNLVGQGSVVGLDIADICFGAGVLLNYCQDYSLAMRSTSSTSYGALLWGNDYEGTVDYENVTSGSRCGLVTAIAAGDIDLTARIVGGRYPLVLCNGSVEGKGQLYIAPSAATEISVIAKACGSAVSRIDAALNIDDEVGGALKTAVFLAGMNGVIRGTIQSAGQPSITIDGGGALTFDTCSFTTSAPEIAHIVSAPVQPVAFVNCQTPVGVPLADNLAAVRVV